MKSFCCKHRLVLLIAVLAALLFSCRPGGSGGGSGGLFPPQEPPAPRLDEVWPPRAVWVVRRTWQSPEQIIDLMEQCKQLGLNTVIFQVRGNGTVYYQSDIEPWDYAFEGRPDFDPLEIACREAHRRGMALHAWVNVMPAWKGDVPPNDPDQLYNKYPEWFWYDQKMQRQPLGWYVSLNPCLPEVRRYLVDLFEELITDYPVDGLHMDYIRFPSETNKGKDYPYDARTLALFRQTTGQTPTQAPQRWTEWRVQQVTQLVRDIRNMMRRERPGALLTAAVGSKIEHHRQVYFQDGSAWLREGLIDAAFTMNYTSDNAVFRDRQEAWLQAVPGKHVIPGLGLHLHKDDRISINQLEFARYWGCGFCLFSSECLFDGSPRSNQRLQALTPAIHSLYGNQ